MKTFEKSLFGILIFTFLTQAVFAQTNTETFLPLKFNTGNPAPYGLPSTVINIQGKKLPILLDTGAKKFGLALSPYALKNLHVKFTNEKICSKAFDGTHCYKIFIIPKVQLGNFIIKNVKGVLMLKLWGGSDNNFKTTDASRNGVIGYALLSKFNLLLDYNKSKALLVQPRNKPTQYNISKWVSTSFDNHLKTKLKLNGKLLTFIWDTGAVPSGISKSIAKHFKQTHWPENNPYHESINNFRIESAILTTQDNKNFPTTWFNISDYPAYAPFDGIIGANFYADNLVYFDFDNHKIYVKVN